MSSLALSSAIDKQSPIPAYHQLTLILRSRILNSEWNEGSKIPKEKDLATLYGVSRVTVRQALDVLEQEGLIRRLRRSGTFVQKVPLPVVHDFSLPSTLCSKLGQRGISLDATILELSLVDAVPHINTILKLKHDQQLVHVRRLFQYNDVAIALNESWISHELAPGLEEEGLIDNHLSQTLSTRYNLSPVNIKNTIESVNLNIEEIQQLSVNFETPVLSVASISYLPYDVPLEYSRTLWRGDRVKFSFEME